MKKRFYTKKKKIRKGKKLFFFLMFVLGLYLSFILIDQTKIEITDKKIVSLLLQESNFIEKESTISDILKNILSNYKNPTNLLLTKQTKETIKQQPSKVTEKDPQTSSPLIYIYNSHQTEEYAPSSFLEYDLKPTVMVASYILEDVFNKNNLNTIVEERKIKDILNQNNWKYNYSYKASRIYLEDVIATNSSLEYFIDVHRDSLSKEKTTVEINGKSYAKTIFLIGLENPDYEKNLSLAEKINNKINERYPNLSKGIYKKGGPGVNGVYNQDFSPNTILIEIGGKDNTTSEVLNSTLAFAECFMEVINENEG